MGPEVPGLVPTIGVAAPDVHAQDRSRCHWQVDRLWKPGNSIQLAIGQGDLLVTPLQMARFYSLIANGGKLVTPHVLEDVENPNGTAVPVPALPAPQQVQGLDPSALAVVRQGLFEGTHMPFGTSYAVFGQFPVPIAGKTGTAEKVVTLPGYTRRAEPVVVVRVRAGHLGEARRLRRDRERRPRRHRRGAGGRASLLQVLPRQRPPGGPDPLRLMLEYAGSQRTGLRDRRVEGPALVGILRSLDWVLLAGVAGLVAVGLWGIAGVTRFDIPGNASYYLDRQIVYAVVGGVALVVATFIDPDLYRRYWRAIFIGTVGLIAIVLVLGRAARGSTRWINVGFFTFQPSEFGKLLFVLALAGFIAERSRQLNEIGTTIRVIGLGLVPVVLVFAQPDLGTALVYLAALWGRCSSSPARRGSSSARSARSPLCSSSASSGQAPPSASTSSRATRSSV